MKHQRDIARDREPHTMTYFGLGRTRLDPDSHIAAEPPPHFGPEASLLLAEKVVVSVGHQEPVVEARVEVNRPFASPVG